MPTDTHHAITDVPGVRVGHVTVDGGGDVHTGVTAIVSERDLDPLFRAAGDAVEEALLNSLFAAADPTGFHGHRRLSVPHDGAVRRLRTAGVLPIH